MTSTRSTLGARPTSPPGEHVVVVGAGTAGNAAAERLRERGFTGRLSIVGDEPHRPYNRTLLSKQLLTDEYTVADLPLPTYTDIDAEWHLGQSATGLDTRNRVLTLASGQPLRYDGLVLAPGVGAKALPGAPLDAPDVHVLRTVEDAVAIDRSLGRARDRLLVVGGGFIGCELASTARARGLNATIVDISPVLLHRGLGSTLGQAAADLHRRNGVEVHVGVGVHSWQAHHDGLRVLLTDGTTIAADAAVVGVGTSPQLDWLAGSGLDTSNGILTEATCHARHAGTAQPVDGVVVAGDVARWPNLRFDDVPRRVEHWINAIEMGQAAADSLLTGPSGAQPFTPLPRFWSEQHGVKFQSAGAPHFGDTLTVLHGSVQQHAFLAAFTRPTPAGDQLMGLIAADAPRALLDHTPLIGRPVRLPAHAPTMAA